MSGALCYLLLPGGIGPDLGGGFTVKAFDIGAHMFIVGGPFVEVAKQQMVLAAPGGAQRDEVAGIKL
jgi:hypothetical protein